MSTARDPLSADNVITRLSRCRGCYAPADGLETILNFDPMPLVGHFASSPQEAAGLARYPCTVVYCTSCGLLQVLEDVDDHVLFDSYRYKSGSVPAGVRHFGAYANDLAARYGHGSLAVLEIGCNDGVFLRQMPSTWRRVGVDPSDVAAEAADGTYELVNEHFSSDLASGMVADGPFDIVVSSNCIAHVSDMRDMLQGAALALRDGGDLWIEAHDREALLSGQWDAIYHEHKAYWSVDSLARCARPLGLELQEAATLPAHGGLLRVRLRKVTTAAAGDPPRRPSFDRLIRAYTERRASPAYERIEHALASGTRVACYGASGRAAVWFNQLAELRFAYVVDDSALRANTWVAGVALHVVDASVFRAGPPDLCVITAWNYAADIKRRHPWFGGTWLQSLALSEGSVTGEIDEALRPRSADVPS